jgi:Fe-S-cluster containining protein
MSTASLDTAISAVTALFDEAEAATTAFAAKSGLGCRAGCGDCCNQHTVETTVTEMLPLARVLLERGDAAAVFEAATAAKGAPCVMYRGSPGDPTKGRCSVYAVRPLICRLFGFAAVSSKTGSSQMATCKYQKTLFPDAVARAEALAAQGEAPRFADFAMRVGAAIPGTDSRRLPINAALADLHHGR